MADNPYRELPQVDNLVDQVESSLPRLLKVAAARDALREARELIGSGETPNVGHIYASELQRAEREAGISVINASGVLLHTNLGRARWSGAAVAAAAGASAHYTNVELDLESGERSRRGRYVERLLCALTGAEAAHIVNNNASALLLALAATAGGTSVPVSRGELIEIGGSYRLPAVMEAGGVNLVEVGTTNRTRIGDYQVAVQTHRCGAILKVHPSNYRISGFTSEATISELAELASSRSIPLIHDLGSGLLDSSATWVPAWLRTEPAVVQSIESGANLVLFSGDKLLGGPQAGIIAGSSHWVDTMRKHPLSRALRVDGTTYAALGATLAAYANGDVETIPFWRAALLDPKELETRTRVLADRVGGSVEEGASAVGGGSAPETPIPGWILRLSGEAAMYVRLLEGGSPVLTRREGGDLIVDLRAVDTEDDTKVGEAILRCR